MSSESNLHGVIHGKIIELTCDPGFGEGQAVEVVVRAATTNSITGEGLRRAAGALADDPDWDRIMEEIHADRVRDVRRDVPE